MSSYRQIHSKIWSDPWFIELPADEKLVFIYLFSNDRANVAGIYDISPRIISFETAIPIDRINEILQDLEVAGKIKRDGNWLWIVNLFTYNGRNIESDKIKAHVANCLKESGSTLLIELWMKKYGILLAEYGIDTVSIPNRTDTDTDTDTDTIPETETKELAAAKNAARPNGRNFDDWHDDLSKANPKDRPPILLDMFRELYPNHDPPTYGYLGSVAKKVGGAGRLAELLWQHSTRPPTGNVLDYIQKLPKAKGKFAEDEAKHAPEEYRKQAEKWGLET